MLRLSGDALPDVAGRRPLLWALAVDTLGVGLFLPLSFYFFTVSTSLSVSGLGLTMSAATLTALALSPVTGMLTDRLGARPMVVTSNLMSAAGYLCYPLAGSYLQVYCAVLAVMSADRLYAGSWPTLITQVSRPSQIDSWFALVQAVGAGCLGVGSLLSTLVLTDGGLPTLVFLVEVNAATCLAAAALTASLRLDRAQGAPSSAVRMSLTPVLRDRPFRRIVAAQLLICTAFTVPMVFLPLYVDRTLHLGQWAVTLAYSANYFLLLFAQVWVTHRFRAARRTRLVAAAGALFVASFMVTGTAALWAQAIAVAVLLLGVVIQSGGEMLLGPSVSAITANLAPSHLCGTYMSLIQAAGVMAYGVGPALVGPLFDISPGLILLIIGGCVTAGAALILTAEPLVTPEALRRVGG